jgi:hypothetical protein
MFDYWLNLPVPYIIHNADKQLLHDDEARFYLLVDRIQVTIP